MGKSIVQKAIEAAARFSRSTVQMDIYNKIQVFPRLGGGVLLVGGFDSRVIVPYSRAEVLQPCCVAAHNFAAAFEPGCELRAVDDALEIVVNGAVRSTLQTTENVRGLPDCPEPSYDILGSSQAFGRALQQLHRLRPKNLVRPSDAYHISVVDGLLPNVKFLLDSARSLRSKNVVLSFGRAEQYDPLRISSDEQTPRDRQVLHYIKPIV